MVVNEAQTFGLPVLTTCFVGSSPELVNDSTGVVIDSGSCDAIEVGIKKLMSTQYSKQSIQEHAELYSPIKCAANFIKILEAHSSLGGGSTRKVYVDKASPLSH